MRYPFLLVVLPLLLARALGQGEDAGPRLQGVWAVEAVERHGDPVLLGLRLEGKGEVRFAGDRMTLAHFERTKSPPGEELYEPEFTVRLAPPGTPGAIELTVRNGPRKGKT